MIFRAGLPVLMLLAMGLPRAADAPAKNWLIAPITTEFQRVEISQEARAYCVVNYGAILPGGLTDPAMFDPQAFRNELAPLGAGKGTIYVVFRGSLASENVAGKDILQAAVKQFCRDAGFERVLSTEVLTSADWKEDMDVFSRPQPGDEGDEPIVMDQSARAVAIRTRLSRFLTGDADCVVELRRPLDARSTGTAEEIHAIIAEPIERLKPAKKGYLQLRVTTTEGGQPLIDRFVSAPPGGGSQADRLATSLGFNTCRIRHTPTGGAPEKLIDQPAPDFTLEALEGPPIRLSEQIRGRVAFVTFWGVACGPCRREAPHLTALYQKYKDAGFAVVAVNAYDETRDEVIGYARGAMLTHPICLAGSKVCEESYHVGAFPTAFWVDHNGKIVDYLIGFDPGDESFLEATLQQMLEQRSAASGQ